MRIVFHQIGQVASELSPGEGRSHKEFVIQPGCQILFVFEFVELFGHDIVKGAVIGFPHLVQGSDGFVLLFEHFAELFQTVL